jgi:hypothetical protein
MSISLKLSALLLLIPALLWSVPAFPGAEGWGQNSTGGRGGQVIHVTTLSSYGPGSISAALAVSGAKIIVFDTAGVIDLGNSPLTLSSNTYIAGQTAPGGITLIHGGLYTPYGPGASNIIIRFIRVRIAAHTADGDCFRFSNAGSHDIVLDHSSGFWNCDETLDMSYACYNITIQNVMLAEPGQCSQHFGSGSGEGNNRTACLSTENDGRITFYKVVWAHSMKRNPYCSNGGLYTNLNKTYELINNVFYDCMPGSSETFDANNSVPLNLVGNYYKGGSGVGSTWDYGSNPFAHGGTIVTSGTKKMHAYVKGNYHYKYPTLTAPAAFFYGLTVTAFDSSMNLPQRTSDGAILTAQNAFTACMAGSGVLPRDSAERRIISQIINKTGAALDTCDITPDPFMRAAGSSPTRAATDTDRDGMPNDWETAHSLDPNNAADATTDMGGYNAVEVYLNELADSIITTVGVEKRTSPLPASGARGLSVLASPNPLNSGVRFTLSNADNSPVAMTVYNIHGKAVYSAHFSNAHAVMTWNGKDMAGRTLGTGTYIVRFGQRSRITEQRISLIR